MAAAITAAPPATMRTARPGVSASGTAMMVATSTSATQAVTSSIGPEVSPRSWSTGITIAADDAASRSRKIAGWSMPLARAISQPTPAANANESTVAAIARPSTWRRRASRSGRRVPTTNMSMANPTDERKISVGSARSSHANPVRPITMPAMISPTTTGSASRVAAESSGPASPHPAISVSTPKVTAGPAGWCSQIRR